MILAITVMAHYVRHCTLKDKLSRSDPNGFRFRAKARGNRITKGIFTVNSDDTEDEDEREHQDNDGVDLESGGLVGVETEHGAAGATGTSGARAGWPHIGELLLLVGSRPAADDVAGSSGGNWGGLASGACAGRGVDWGGCAGRRLFCREENQLAFPSN